VTSVQDDLFRPPLAQIIILRHPPVRLARENSPFVFTSERGSPFTTAGFARMLEPAATDATIAIKVHPHMLRHACGFALANAGHDTRALQAYLGHGALYRVGS
jgi:site-specific recombinase XerD